ncbi:MAG: 2-oxo acid dehydrogenase subunit E2 [Planctomycetaceae bacterium]|nr:2-oxo acid dehydrogenase subunit E2 [Planctomycetaceae bacterium]
MEFKLPEVSEGVTSVDVAEIKVAEGDVITAGTVICEVETDKAVAEIECPHAGTIRKILINVGDSVAVGQPLIEIETGAAAAAPTTKSATAPSSTPQSSAPAPVAPPAPAAAPEIVGSPKLVHFKLPSVSEGVTAVDVADVKVAVGDVIAADAVVCEVETDKAVAEINCPHAGTVRAVHISAGQNIPIGAALIDVETSTATPQSASASGPAPAATSSAAETPAPAGASSTAPVTAPTSTASSQTVSSGGGRPPAPAGPATRRLARKLGVDLYQVKGSARGGRITLEDVEKFVHQRMTSSAAPAGSSMSMGVIAATPLPDFSKFGPVEKQPLNKIFRTAAANLHAAWITIPHVTQHNLADITELEAARQRYVDSNPKSPKITMTAIMIKAVVGALKAFPKVNSSIDMESGELVLKKYYHIGVAVDTPNGLVVPVIRNCDQKNVLQVAAELTELALKARERKLKTEDMQGASFTITNLGGIGGTAFTPIVNHPEVAILGMSRGQKVLQLEDGNVVERLMLPLSMSYDHRAINGADAARFIVKLSGSLTNFFELF